MAWIGQVQVSFTVTGLMDVDQAKFTASPEDEVTDETYDRIVAQIEQEIQRELRRTYIEGAEASDIDVALVEY